MKRSTDLRVAVVTQGHRGGRGGQPCRGRAGSPAGRKRRSAHHWVGFGTLPDPPHRRYLRGSSWSKLAWSASAALSRACSLPDQFTPEIAYLWSRREVDYSLYHFHDISSAVSPFGMRWLARRRPVVWTFHDCSPFTGGCLYPLGCERFKTRCGGCPQLGRWPLEGRWDFTGWMQDVKRRTAKDDLFVAVAPSRWMADEAMSSGMFARRPVVIPNGVDLELFRPHDKALVRQLLALPTDAFLVLLSAGNLSDPRKGMALALEALRQCDRPIQVLLVGEASAAFRSELGDLTTHHSGYVNDGRLLAMYYAAADVILFPSLAESFGLTLSETMATGTPAIAFRTGGVPEIIGHNVTGWLADAGDTSGLAQGLRLAYDQPDLVRRWADAGRRTAVERYDPGRFLQAHLELYESVLAGRQKLGRSVPH